MLLAIDAGNTQTVYGAWDGSAWRALWRRSTDADETEDQLGVWLKGAFDLAGLPFEVDCVIAATVVPAIEQNVVRLADKWLKAPHKFLRNGEEVGLEVRYEPKTAVGADRIANALGALEKRRGPIIVVDFGTATTFDVVDRGGAYAGGAILPGVQISSQALFGRTSKLPQVPLTAPECAIGRNTVESLQSGIMLGYSGAIDSLARRIDIELGGGSWVVATGGLGKAFVDLCETIQDYDAYLTLDGLVIAAKRLGLTS